MIFNRLTVISLYNTDILSVFHGDFGPPERLQPLPSIAMPLQVYHTTHNRSDHSL